MPQFKGKKRYQPRNDLSNCAKRLPTAGKVVAELKFAFWQTLFVKGQQARLWDKHFADVFPGYDRNLTVKQARAAVYDDLEIIRRLRNRIAHHEPIFAHDLEEDRNRIRKLIAWRRPAIADWVDGIEDVSELLGNRPA